MSADRMSELLPPLYAGWMSALLQGPIPREARALCHSCAMCGQGTEGPRPAVFSPLTKCCSYTPALPNFLVGRILMDPDASLVAGREAIENRIQAGIDVSPVGLLKPPVIDLISRNAPQAFGRSQAFVCPYYLQTTGSCGIWQHRDSVCTTWFCKFVRGNVGMAFWASMRELLTSLEVELAQWCVLQLDLDDAALTTVIQSSGWGAEAEGLTAEAIDNVPDATAHADLWGDWQGREIDFFQRCASLVETMSWQGVLDVCSPDTRARAWLVHRDYDRLMSEDLPEALQLAPLRVLSRREGMVRLATGNGYDPFEMTDGVFNQLPQFNGRQTTLVLAGMDEDLRSLFSYGFLRQLMDFGILLPA